MKVAPGGRCGEGGKGEGGGGDGAVHSQPAGQPSLLDRHCEYEPPACQVLWRKHVSAPLQHPTNAAPSHSPHVDAHEGGEGGVVHRHE